jgi:hypothetical protein
MSRVGNLNVFEPPKQTVETYSESVPFIETGLKPSDLKNFTFPDLEPGYVAVVCSDEKILLLQENIVQQCDETAFLASARPANNLGETIYMVNENATLKNMKTICQWLNQHIIFENMNYPDDQRKQYDQNFFNGKNYKEVMQLMHLSIFLRTHPFNWHEDQQKKKLALEGIRKADHELEPIYLHEFCANVLGDMMASCKTPLELQSMFPDLIGDQALTAEDKYDIIVNDAWIHGDDGVNFLLNKLRQQSGEPIQNWNENNEDRIRILQELGLAPDAKIETIKIQGPNDTGNEVNANWWG